MMEDLEGFTPEIGLDFCVGILGQLFVVVIFSWHFKNSVLGTRPSTTVFAP